MYRGKQPVRLAYRPSASSTFLSEQISHQQPASSTFLSEQINTSHQPNEQAEKRESMHVFDQSQHNTRNKLKTGLGMFAENMFN
jgi:hypothetical protein